MKACLRFIRKQYKLLLAILLLLLALGVQSRQESLTGSLSSQNLSQRWNKDGGFGQVSCFFSAEDGLSEAEITALTAGLNTALQEAAITGDENQGRNLVMAYSHESQISLSRGKNAIDARAYGVSKDFFLFHPLELLDGTYFSDADDNRDGIILDENTAWQLFGGLKVAGMEVCMGDKTFVVRGVVHSEEGKYSQSAGADQATVYLDYQVLADQGDSSYDDTYDSSSALEDLVTFENLEVMMIEPVKNFTYDTLQNVLDTSLSRESGSYVIVNNAKRYSMLSRLKWFGQIGKRSMTQEGISYPYWENRARAYEDLSGGMMLIEILLLLYPVAYAIYWVTKGCIFFKAWWSKKTLGQRVEDVNSFIKKR